MKPVITNPRVRMISSFEKERSYPFFADTSSFSGRLLVLIPLLSKTARAFSTSLRCSAAHSQTPQNAALRLSPKPLPAADAARRLGEGRACHSIGLKPYLSFRRTRLRFVQIMPTLGGDVCDEDFGVGGLHVGHVMPRKHFVVPEVLDVVPNHVPLETVQRYRYAAAIASVRIGLNSNKD
jgi:hypothetical protein